MSRRTDLQVILETLIGSTNVYFQPPETIKMVYPCIVYEHYSGRTFFADNKPYTHSKCYQITVIDKNPDSVILDAVVMLPMCMFNRHFAVDNLNHDIYILYY